MHFTTDARWSHGWVWLFWFLALLTWSWRQPIRTDCAMSQSTAGDQFALAIVVQQPQAVFPWRSRVRWRKWMVCHCQAAQQAYRRAVWAAHGARLLLGGALTMATVVDWLTRSQLRRHLGALPILYRLLEILQLRQIINRHCPGTAQVDHGTVALVLVLNRLSAPRPLYQVADWLGQTVLVTVLGVPAAKFNDDRLGRTLDALAAHSRDIWLDVVHQALQRFEIDLRFLFYDLTALVGQGAFTDSALLDYGFAHNTPMDKQKLKLGVSATADGAIPSEYALYSGRTADMATVQDNLERLGRLLAQQGCPLGEVLLIGDRANLNAELALTYDRKGLKYLAGLQPLRKEHRAFLLAVPEGQFYRQPLTDPVGSAPGYFGMVGVITFEHDGQTVRHRGLVVLSGPMRRAVRQGRARQLHTLRANLAALRAKIGQKRYRTVQEVQARAATCLRHSPVGPLMVAEAYQTATGQVDLRWAIDRPALLQAMHGDGRYLLVTNDFHLAPRRMLELYRSKDALEKRFEVAKQDLRVRPLYVHSDTRIRAMLLVNLLALLAYSLLERQLRLHGLQLTTRRVIQQLETLTVIETHCWDGSLLRRLTPVDAEQARLWALLSEILADLLVERFLPALPAPGGRQSGLPLAPPGTAGAPPLAVLA
jgi:transposase